MVGNGLDEVEQGELTLGEPCDGGIVGEPLYGLVRCLQADGVFDYPLVLAGCRPHECVGLPHRWQGDGNRVAA